MRLLISSVRDYAIFMVDPNGYVASWNEGAERIKGYTEAEILGTHIDVFYTDADRAADRAAGELEAAIASGRSEDQGWRKRKDGSLFWADVVTTRIVGEDGELVGFAKIVRDLTEQKRADDDLRTLMQQREDFVATLTHDLKTPIVAANRAIKLLLEGDFGEIQAAQAELLRTILDSNEAMYRLVASLLDVYRYDSGAKQLAVAIHDLSETVQTVLRTLQPIARSKGIDLAAIVPPHPVVVECDKEELSRVLQNLLGNALKFTPPGGSVQVELLHSPQSTTIAVRDTGKGLSQEEQQALFKRFHQPASRSRAEPGAGLGLYLSKQIVEAHGGYIGCKSTPGEGSTFFFTLPNRQDQRNSKAGHGS